VETVADFKEVIDEIKEAGGDAFKDASNADCAIRFVPGTGSGLQHAQAGPAGHLRFYGDRKRRYVALHHLRKMPPAVPQGRQQIESGVALRRVATEYEVFPASVKRPAPPGPASFPRATPWVKNAKRGIGPRGNRSKHFPRRWKFLFRRLLPQL
jgi:hypothetical protein